MSTVYNNFAFDISERASIPRSFNYTIGVNSAEKLKIFLYRVIHTESANRKLYLRLVDKGFNKPVHIKDVQIEVLPGKFIPVYFILRKDGKGNYGSSGATRGFFPESRITLSLFADTEEDIILWSDSYASTIDHELTHTFQAMDVAIRYLYMQNIDTPNYNPSYDEIMKWLTKVNVKNQKYNKELNKGIHSDPNKYVKYLGSDKEMGARAHALLRELYAKDRRLFREVIEFCETGWPSFDYINRQLSKDRWHGWQQLTNFGNLEIRSNGITEYETQAYALKQKLLQKLYDFYLTQYRGR